MQIYLTRLFSIILFLGHSYGVFGQKEGNVWHFGKGITLDFNSGTPLIATGSKMWTFEGCAAISDSTGKPLFYTNGGGRDSVLSGQPGGKIWNGANELIYDMGNTEGGGFSAVQSSVFVPSPGGQPGRYLLFTMEEVEFNIGGPVVTQPLGRGLSIFELDASLNGGKGGVVSYEGAQYVPAYEALCAIRHSNGKDYWILIIDGNNGAIVVFSVNESGINQAGQYFSGHNSLIKGAPDGRHIVTVGTNGPIVYQFDPETGVITLPQELTGVNSSYFEFSPNGRYMYTVSGTSQNLQVLQFNVESSDIITSQKLIGGYGGGGNPPPAYTPGQMQVAPDGRIYFVIQEYSLIFPINRTFLSVINCPNSPDAFMDFNVLSFLRDGSGNSQGDFFGLPNFDNAIFFRESIVAVDLGVDTLAVCNDTLVLDPQLGAGLSYLWNTGATTPTLAVTLPGWYSVAVTDECGYSGVDSVFVVEGLSVSIEIQGDPCAPGARLLQAKASGGLGTYQYIWNNNSTGASLNAAASGGYSVTVTDASGCSGSAVIQVTVTGPPNASISVAQAPDPCNGGYVTLTAAGGVTYLWSTGAPVAEEVVLQNGIYTVTVTDAAGCSATASADVVLATGTGLSIAVTGQGPACNGDTNGSVSATVSGGLPPYSWIWSTGIQTPSLVNLTAGTYSVTLTDDGGCSVSGTISLEEPDPLDWTLSITNLLCGGTPSGVIDIDNISGGRPPFLLTLNQGTAAPVKPGDSLEGLVAGDYELVLTDSAGCAIEQTVSLSEPQPLSLTLTPLTLDLELGFEAPVKVWPTYLPDSVLILWSPAQGLSCTDCLTPNLAPIFSTEYGVSVTDLATGCTDTAILPVKVIRRTKFLVPNVFTPNDDGVHDVLPLFASKSLDEVIFFTVYDRWGSLVHESQNPVVNDQFRGWDGRFNGKYLVPGVYVWRARVRWIDGGEQDFEGEVTIVR